MGEHARKSDGRRFFYPDFKRDFIIGADSTRKVDRRLKGRGPVLRSWDAEPGGVPKGTTI